LEQHLDRDPAIATVMTPFPHSIDADATVADAERLMEMHGVAHLPVHSGSALVGVVSTGDIALLRERSHRADVTVRGACSGPPYVVDLHESLGTVARELAVRHLEAALVVRDGRLAGIFTTGDACRVLARLLRKSEQDTDGGVA